MTYQHNNKDPNLNNLHHAMEYSNDLPHLRVTLGSDTITISGDVNLVDNVRVNNTEEQSIPVHLTSNATVSITGPVSVTGPVGITGPVSVTGSVTAYQGTTPWSITGSIVASITGTVATSRDETASTVTAFGEQYGVTITPVIQLDGIYGITSDVIQTYNNGTGSSASATPAQGLFVVQSGTSVGGYGVLRSRRFLRYRPGQGALTRFTAAFTPNTPNTSQRAGLFNEENALMVGWNTDPTSGLTKFGVLRATGGKAEIRQLTINSISTGNQTLTITLNSVQFTIPNVNTADPRAAAVAINAADGFTGWLVDQVDNTLVFLSDTLGSKNGTYSITGSGTVSGTFVQRQAGVAQTENWTYQDEFNLDRLDGTKGGVNDIGKNPSGMLLRSQYLNVYQINFRWLGAGEIRFAIEDNDTGKMIFFHKIHYTNRNSLPHLANPSFKIGYVAYSTGSTTNVSVSGASMMGAIEGTINQNELNRSGQSSKAGLNKDICYHMMTIRNPYVTNGKVGALNGNFILNAKEIILKDISVGVQGNDPGIVYLFYNASSFSGTHTYVSQPRDNGMISTADGTLDYTVDTAICRFVTAINGSSAYPLNDFRIAIPPGDSISIAIQSTAALARVSVALVFSED